MRTILQVSKPAAPLHNFRLAVYKDRIYWRNWNPRPDPDLELVRTIRSSTETGPCTTARILV